MQDPFVETENFDSHIAWEVAEHGISEVHTWIPIQSQLYKMPGLRESTGTSSPRAFLVGKRNPQTDRQRQRLRLMVEELRGAVEVRGPGIDTRAERASLIDAWVRASEVIDEERFRIDVEYVLRRLTHIFPMAQAAIWMESSNERLGSRPLDVLALRGAASVISAVDAEEQGAY